MSKYVGALWVTLALIPLNSANAGGHFFPDSIERDAGTQPPFPADAVRVAQAHPEPGDAPSIDGPSLPDFESRFAKGQYEFGFSLGYGFNFNLPPTGLPPSERTDFKFVYFSPNFKYNLTGLIGKSIYRGAFYWVVEAGAAITTSDPTRNNQKIKNGPNYVFSLVPAQLEYKFLNPGRTWAPFLFAGGGVSWGDWHEETKEISTAFEFVVQTGGGIEYFFANGTAMNIQYHFWHLSNAKIKSPNIGINTHIISLGYSF